MLSLIPRAPSDRCYPRLCVAKPLSQVTQLCSGLGLNPGLISKLGCYPASVESSACPAFVLWNVLNAVCEASAGLGKGKSSATALKRDFQGRVWNWGFVDKSPSKHVMDSSFPYPLTQLLPPILINERDCVSVPFVSTHMANFHFLKRVGVKVIMWLYIGFKFTFL